MDGTSLGSAGFVELSRGLRAPTCVLEELSAANNSAGPSGAAALAASLPDTLKVLRLASNALGDDGAAALARASTSSTSQQQQQRNGVSSGADAADAGGNASPPLVRLRILDVARNGIGAAGASALVEAAKEGLACELVLLGNTLGDQGVRSLADALAKGSGSNSPEFRTTSAEDTAAAAAPEGNTAAFEGALPPPQQQQQQREKQQLLKVLDLTGTGLTEAGLPHLLEAVAAWPPHLRLTSLVLGGNKCVGGTEGQAALDAFKSRTGVDVAVDTEADSGKKEEGDATGGGTGIYASSNGSGGGQKEGAPPLPPPSAGVTGAPAPASAVKQTWVGQAPPTKEEVAAAAAAHPPNSFQFKLGDSVTVVGLSSAVRFNGQAGIVSSGLLNGRVAVWIEAEKKSISIKPENIEAAAASLSS